MSARFNLAAGIALLGVLHAPAVFAEECFKASGDLGNDAQVIRQTASQMGWIVGNAASLGASGIAKGKVKLYPKGTTMICMKLGDHDLMIRIQSDSSDAGDAKWHKLASKKT